LKLNLIEIILMVLLSVITLGCVETTHMRTKGKFEKSNLIKNHNNFEGDDLNGGNV
jgi:hypothetical protein